MEKINHAALQYLNKKGYNVKESYILISWDSCTNYEQRKTVADWARRINPESFTTVRIMDLVIRESVQREMSEA